MSTVYSGKVAKRSPLRPLFASCRGGAQRAAPLRGKIAALGRKKVMGRPRGGRGRGWRLVLANERVRLGRRRVPPRTSGFPFGGRGRGRLRRAPPTPSRRGR